MSAQAVTALAKEMTESMADLKDLQEEFTSKEKAAIALIKWVNGRGLAADVLDGLGSPFCIFMGMESVGKSTTINHVLGGQAVFVHAKTGTRSPMQILVEPQCDKAHFRVQGGEWEDVTDLQHSYGRVQQHMEKVQQQPPGLSEQHVQLTIPTTWMGQLSEGAQSLALTLWDTPGIALSSPIEGYDEKTKDLSNMLVSKYATRDRSWLFLVEDIAYVTEACDRAYPRNIVDAKHVAVVLTKIDSGLRKFVDNQRQLKVPGFTEGTPTSDDLVLRVKELFKGKMEGIVVEEVFFAYGDTPGDAADLQSKLEAELGRCGVTGTVQGIGHLREFISDQMMRTVGTIAHSVIHALRASKEETTAKINVCRTHLRDRTTTEQLVLEAFRATQLVVKALATGDACHDRIDEKLRELGIFDAVQSTLHKLRQPGTASAARASIEDITFVSHGHFTTRIYELSHAVLGAILQLAPKKKTEVELASHQSFPSSSGPRNEALLTQVLDSFLLTEVHRPLHQKLYNLFLAEFDQLADTVTQILAQSPKLGVLLTSPGPFAQAFKESLSRCFRDEFALGDALGACKDTLSRIIRSPQVAIRATKISAVAAAPSASAIAASLRDFSEVQTVTQAMQMGGADSQALEKFNAFVAKVAKHALTNYCHTLDAALIDGADRVRNITDEKLMAAFVNQTLPHYQPLVQADTMLMAPAGKPKTAAALATIRAALADDKECGREPKHIIAHYAGLQNPADKFKRDEEEFSARHDDLEKTLDNLQKAQAKYLSDMQCVWHAERAETDAGACDGDEAACEGDEGDCKGDEAQVESMESAAGENIEREQPAVHEQAGPSRPHKKHPFKIPRKHHGAGS